MGNDTAATVQAMTRQAAEALGDATVTRLAALALQCEGSAADLKAQGMAIDGFAADLKAQGLAIDAITGEERAAYIFFATTRPLTLGTSVVNTEQKGQAPPQNARRRCLPASCPTT